MRYRLIKVIVIVGGERPGTGRHITGSSEEFDFRYSIIQTENCLLPIESQRSFFGNSNLSFGLSEPLARTRELLAVFSREEVFKVPRKARGVKASPIFALQRNRAAQER